jgi:hypothetical protein
VTVNLPQDLQAAQEETARRNERSMAAVRALIAERVPGRFATFHDVGHEIFPNGLESTSGHVILEDGREFIFWMDWDAERGRPVLGTWEDVTDEPRRTRIGDEEHRARAAVGLA